MDHACLLPSGNEAGQVLAFEGEHRTSGHVLNGVFSQLPLKSPHSASPPLVFLICPVTF